jgi:hypothetical protein
LGRLNKLFSFPLNLRQVAPEQTSPHRYNPDYSDGAKPSV